MSDRVVVVGEAPSFLTDGGEPLSGRSGKWIAWLAGVDDLASVFELVNVFDRWPGRQGKASAFPAEAARARGFALADEYAGRRLVLLGRRVAAAFALPRSLPYFYWTTRENTAYVVAPHPSKISVYWNRPENVDRAVAFWRRLAREEATDAARI